MQRAQQGAVFTSLVDTVSAANTAAATSAWVAIPTNVEGDIEIVHLVGAVTGSLTATFQTADDNSGTNAASVVFNEGAFTAVSTANHGQKRTVPRSALSQYVKYTGTIVTGPVLVGVHMVTVGKNL